METTTVMGAENDQHQGENGGCQSCIETKKSRGKKMFP